MDEHTQPSHQATGVRLVVVITLLGWIFLPALFALAAITLMLLNEGWPGWGEALQKVQFSVGPLAIGSAFSGLLNGSCLGRSLNEKDGAYSWNNAFGAFAASLAMGLVWWVVFSELGSRFGFTVPTWCFYGLMAGGGHVFIAAIVGFLHYD